MKDLGWYILVGLFIFGLMFIFALWIDDKQPNKDCELYMVGRAVLCK